MSLLRRLRLALARDTITDISTLPPFPELKKRVRLVVVDDEQDSFPTAGLQDDGYAIEWWPKVDAPKLRRLEESDFDIVILDIQNIAAPGLSDTGDGLGILRRLKSVNPDQTVVAFSGNQYDLASIPFFRLTDDTLRKPVTLIQCKECIDRLIQQRVSVRSYWDNLVRLLARSNVKRSRVRALEKTVAIAAKEGRLLTMDDVRNAVGNVESLATVFGWVRKIIQLCTIAL